ncbi:MAG: type II toxin-antitoxin system RelE/ParE family toxin [archaeon]|nr:type II toxin-antitoxin system RelE/ParE family toxin [archaeon]
MSWKIFVSLEFEKAFEKLDFSLQKQIDREISQLEENPYVGKPLGYKFLREKKVHNYRVYFLIYDELVVVFVIALSDKKGQQKAISAIKKLIPFYRVEIRKKLGFEL